MKPARYVPVAAAALTLACGAPAGTAPLTDADVTKVIEEAPEAPRRIPEEARELARRLEAHVLQMIERWPLAPLFYTNNVNRRWFFNEPRQTLCALSTALPYLSGEARRKVKAFLRSHVQAHPPLRTDYYQAAGRGRFPFEDAPDEKRRGKAANKEYTAPHPFHAVWALWSYSHLAGEKEILRAEWRTAAGAFRHYFQRPREFKPSHRDDTEVELNRAVNSTIGYARIASALGERAALDEARTRLKGLLEERLALEDDPVIVHNIDEIDHGLPALARYLELSAEVGRLVRSKADGERLHDWIDLNPELCPDWYMAWHERPTGLANPGRERGQWGRPLKSVEYVGGEYFLTSPLLPSSIFLAKSRVLGEEPGALEGFLDMPWCLGDLYYIEKVADVLWAYAGRPWRRVAGGG